MRIIGVTGGKGGTGKSTLSVALACQLAKKSKVLLVDADVDCPNDHLLLAVSRKFYKKVEQRVPQWDLKKCIRCGLCGTVCQTKAVVSIRKKNPIFISEQCNGCGACLLRCSAKAINWGKKEIGKLYRGNNYGVDILSGELKPGEPAAKLIVDALLEDVERTRSDYDSIIIDTAAGIHCPVVAALEICDVILAVAEPTPLGCHDLELTLRILSKIRTRIVINRSNIGNKDSIYDLAVKYNRKIIGEIPYQKRVFEQYAHGQPIIIKNIKKIKEKL